MAESLKERLLRAREDADRERLSNEDRDELAAREAERAPLDLSAEADKPARVLTDEEATRAAVGGAGYGLAGEIAEMTREGIATIDRAYRENTTGA